MEVEVTAPGFPPARCLCRQADSLTYIGDPTGPVGIVQILNRISLPEQYPEDAMP